MSSEDLKRFQNKRAFRRRQMNSYHKQLLEMQHVKLKELDVNAITAIKTSLQDIMKNLAEQGEEAFTVLSDEPGLLAKETDAQEQFDYDIAPVLKLANRLLELHKMNVAYRKLHMEGRELMGFAPSPTHYERYDRFVSLCQELLTNDDILRDHAEIATAHAATESLMEEVKTHLYPPAEEDDGDESSTPAAPDIPPMYGTRLTLDVPDFDGQPRAWKKFKEMFEVVLESRGRYLSDIEKRILLEKSMTTKEARDVIIRNYSGDDPYTKAMKALDDKYGNPRVLLPLLVRDITQDSETYAFNREGLQSLYDKYVLTYEHLKDLIEDSLTTYLCQCAREHFNVKLREEWDKHAGPMKTLPTIQTLGEFIDKYVSQMEPTPMNTKTSSKSTPMTMPTSSAATNMMRCPFCKGNHTPVKCPAFVAKNVEDRHQMVREARLCLNCLRTGHSSKQCSSHVRCKVCSKPHHTMIHLQKDAATTKPNTPAPTAPSMNVTPSPATMKTPTLSFIDTVIVNVSHGDRHMQARAALDSGAGISMMSEQLASALKLPRHKQRVAFEGIRGKGLSKAYVTVRLSAPHDDAKSMEVSLSVIPRLNAVHKPKNVAGILQHPAMNDLTLSDPDLGGHIDILLGNLDRSSCITGAPMQLHDTKLTLTPTLFGWSVAGPLDGCSPAILQTTAKPDELYQMLSKQWELEAVPEATNHDEDPVIRHFHTTHERNDDGRYVVQLPRTKSPPPLGKSRARAVKRYLSNERSLQDKGTYKHFLDVLQEYVSMGHAEIVPRPMNESSMYYLPVHGVVKETSTTTKLRAVFDASAPTSNGRSLNDTLEAGPNLYPALPDVLIRFRSHPIALSADVGKMFREIMLHPSERDLHRFLMRTPDGQLRDCRMLRLTFGVKSSPFLATQVLRHLASEHVTSHPHASQVISRDFYVDDCLTGVNKLDDAMTLQQDLTNILQSAGMTLRKWRTNDATLLAMIPEELRETTSLSITTSHDVPKALGIHWDSNNDVLHVSTPVDIPEVTATKRTVASLIAQVFDVLGLMASAIIPAKILLQGLWRTSLSWDDPLPHDAVQTWDKWLQQLPDVTSCSIPRRMTDSNSPVMFRALHGFSDASSVAYGAAIYLRTVHEDGHVITTLVTAKARVLPLKPTTIPRAELVAASLMTKLLTHVATVLNIPTHELYAWTDSAIVLHWLHKPPDALKIFVRNRISHIQESLPASHWRHVRSEDNPADLLSRGCTALELRHNPLWWHGPPWLKDDPAQWMTKQIVRITRPVPEMKTPEVNLMMNQVTPTDSIWIQCNSFNRAIRNYAWTLRFVHNARRSLPDRDLSPCLSIKEINSAREQLILQAQQESFPELFNMKTLPHGHFLTRTNIHPPGRLPYFTVSGRVRDRLLIPLRAKSSITSMMLKHFHNLHGHPGTESLMATLGDTYMIQGARQALKKLSKHCVTCQKAHARPLQAKMSDLPTVRTTPAPPFTHVGLDFAGPFCSKRGHTRKPVYEDCYVCLFVCMVTRAVHLDVCQDLSTDEFMATLRRFMARRGTPTTMYSDNGTNFVGANSSIKKFLQDSTTQQSITHLCTKHNFTWKFITPRAPHMGGLWEAGVRCMKAQLRKVVQPHPLRYDELYTVLTEVEASLNSRPMAPLHGDHNPDELVLTPGHFLVQRPLKAPPFPSELALPTKTSHARRWTLVQQLLQTLWDKWLQSYLQSRFARSKWHKSTGKVHVGDIVLIKDITLKRRTWPLGRIMKTFPGADGTVRTVEVLCNGKTYLRAVHLLCPILSDTNEEPQVLLPPPPEAVEDPVPTTNAMMMTYSTTYHDDELTYQQLTYDDQDDETTHHDDEDTHLGYSDDDVLTTGHGPPHVRGARDSREATTPPPESVRDFRRPGPSMGSSETADSNDGLYGTREEKI